MLKFKNKSIKTQTYIRELIHALYAKDEEVALGIIPKISVNLDWRFTLPPKHKLDAMITFLHLAAVKGLSTVVPALLAHGASPKFQSSDLKQTALHFAVRANSPNIIKLLMSHDSSLCEIQDKFGRTPLHLAAKKSSTLQCLKNMLCFRPEKLNVKDNQSATPLHFAALHNNLVGCQLLVKCGLSVHHIDHNGKKAIDWAEEGSQIQMFLREKSVPSLFDMCAVILRKNSEMSQIMDDPNQFLVHIAKDTNRAYLTHQALIQEQKHLQQAQSDMHEPQILRMLKTLNL